MQKAVSLIIGAALLLTARIYAYDDGDFQLWNTDAEEFKINQQAKIVFEEEFRWGDDATEFYYQHYEAGLSYIWQKNFNVGGGYRHIYELKKGKFKLENEPYVSAILFWDFKGFKFEDRNRLEYRHFDYQDDSWRYRNKMMLKLPGKFTRMEIQPYLSDEIFISFNGNTELNQNRFSSGLAINLTKHLKTDIYYLWQSSKKSEEWIDVNILGAKLKITF